jgi:hypothetical protein
MSFLVNYDTITITITQTNLLACLQGIKWSANNWINVQDDPNKVKKIKEARATTPVPDTIVLPHQTAHAEL